MTNPYHEEVENLVEMPGRFIRWDGIRWDGLSATSASFSHGAEYEFFGDYGGYPSQHEGPYLMRESRQATTDLRIDISLEHFYQFDGWFVLDYEDK